jgi:hypothetical protein
VKTAPRSRLLAEALSAEPSRSNRCGTILASPMSTIVLEFWGLIRAPRAPTPGVTALPLIDPRHEAASSVPVAKLRRRLITSPSQARAAATAVFGAKTDTQSHLRHAALAFAPSERAPSSAYQRSCVTPFPHCIFVTLCACTSEDQAIPDGAFWAKARAAAEHYQDADRRRRGKVGMS